MGNSISMGSVPNLSKIDSLINDRNTTVIKPAAPQQDLKQSLSPSHVKQEKLQCDVCEISYSTSMQIKSHLQTSKHRLKAAIHFALQHRADVPNSTLLLLFKGIVQFIEFAPRTKAKLISSASSSSSSPRSAAILCTPIPENDWRYNDALLVYAYIRQYHGYMIPTNIVLLLLRNIRCEWHWPRLNSSATANTDYFRGPGVSFECLHGNQVLNVHCDIRHDEQRKCWCFRLLFGDLYATKLVIYAEWKCEAVDLYHKDCLELQVKSNDNQVIKTWDLCPEDVTKLQQCKTAGFEGYVQVLDLEMHGADNRSKKRVSLQRCVSYEWKADGMLLQKFKNAAVNKAFYSCNFCACHQNWCLRCIPCNKDGACSLQLALLKMPNNVHSVKADIELRLNNKTLWGSSTNDILFDRSYQWFDNNDLNVIKTSELYFMKEWKLKVEIKILVVYTYDERNKGEPIAVPPCDWHKYNIIL